MSFVRRGAGAISRVGFYQSTGSTNGALATFSTHRTLLNKENNSSKNTNPQLSSFRIRDIASTRRGRIYLYSTFAVLVTIESLTWWNVAPKIFGWESGKDSSEKGS